LVVGCSFLVHGERKPFIVPDERWGHSKKTTGVCGAGEESTPIEMISGYR